MAFDKKVKEARSLAESFREDRSADHPELLAALSWVASGASFAEDWKILQAYPQETYERSSELARESNLDSSPNLAPALGASIEVLGAVYQGLAVVGSTKLFGFANSWRNKVPESEELAYIQGSW